MNIEKFQSNQTPQIEKERPPLTLTSVNAESREDIAAYYKFEIDQGFSQIHPKATFDSMVNFRQQQIKDNKLGVVIAREGDEVVATTTVVLENGTIIATTNYPSMRLRLNVGYRLGGIDQRENETNYLYRKDLTAQLPADKNWKQEVLAGMLKLAETLNDVWPEAVLIDPQNTPNVETALANGYEGVYLLRPEDFEEPRPIDKNLLVFMKKSNEKST